MRWFGRKAPRTVDDPVFGRLTLRQHSGWYGEVSSPISGERLVVSISSLDEPPGAQDRQAFSEFVARFPQLVPALSSELFELLEPSTRIPGWEGPTPETAEELWKMVRLESLHISTGRPLELLFAFRGEVWPDAMFTVTVDAANVRGVSLDD